MEVLDSKAGGGIIITASHNPIEWNALKFLTHEGIFLDEPQVKALFELVDNNRFDWKDWSQVRPVIQREGADERHIEAVLKLPFIQPDRIRAQEVPRRLRRRERRRQPDRTQAAQGPGLRHGSSSTSSRTASSPTAPSPLPRTWASWRSWSRARSATSASPPIPDADRCAIVSDAGKAIGEEYTLALATMLVLEHKKGPVGINLSTSRMVDDIAARHGVPVLRTKVGEINVTVGMKANGSVIGGEGNGGVISPDLHYGRDGILAVAMTLQLMAREEQAAVGHRGRDPVLPYREAEILRGRARSSKSSIGRLLAKFPEAKCDQQDGIRFEWEKSWVHLRASNTEPVVRVIAEAPDKARR